MAQHDYNLANQSGADFRADLNNALSAIVTVNSGATAPSTTFAHQLWVDTSSSVLKIRNSANDAWVTTGVSITADNTFTGNLTGNVTGNVTGDITGNADTATALETARTINGTSFDGTANISFDTDSVSEGSSNLYYTSARFDSAFGGKSTSDLTEGTNLYFTNARVESYLDAGTSTPTFASAVINTSLTGSAILDDDTFGTASVTTVATSESIKAYVDSQVGTVDTLSEILANGNTTGGTDIAFGDNDKAVFGTGSDLEIYHDGSNSRIREVGTGSLLLDAESLYLRNTTGDSYLQGINGGAVNIFYNGSVKLNTTSTGIDVTGTVVSDGLTTSGNLDIVSSYPRINLTDTGENPDYSIINADGIFNIYDVQNASNRLSISSTGNATFAGTVVSDGLTVSDTGIPQILIQDLDGTNQKTFLKQSNGANTIMAQDGTSHGRTLFQSYNGTSIITRQRIDANGDISFYDDTGTTQGLFWDASAESLGIGTTSPNRPLHVYTSATIPASLESTSTVSVLKYENSGQTGSTYVGSQNDDFYFHVNDAERMRIDGSTGNVGIGTGSPSQKLSVSDGMHVTPATAFSADTSGTYTLAVGANSGGKSAIFDQTIVVEGSVGIGTSSPSEKLEVYNNGADVALKIHEDAGTHASRIHLRSGTTDTYIQNRDAANGFEIRTESNISTSDNAALSISNMGVANFGYNVGIGTSSPDSPLHISAATEPYIRIENTDTILTEGQVVGGLAFEQNDSTGGGTGITGRIQMRSADRPDNGSYFGNVADMDFLVSGASTGVASDNATKTAMTIRAGTGSVGIGTDSPSQALHVESSSSGTSKIVGALINPNSGVVGTGAQLWLSGSNATTRGTYIEGQVRGSGNKHDLIFATSGDASTPAERMRITSAGRLGLGTTNPLVRTHIATSVSSGSLVDSLLVSQNTASSTSGQGARILLSSLNASNRAAGIAAIAGSSSNHDLAFYTNGNFAAPTEKMRILANNGNLGIGTDSPSTLLDVAGVTPTLTISDTQDKSWTSSDTTLGELAFRTRDTSGIGAHNVSFIRAVNEVASSTTPSGALSFGISQANNNASEAMRISADGSVGIGTASPSLTYGGKGLNIENNDTAGITINDTTGAKLDLAVRSSDVLIYGIGGYAVRFGQSGTERMRLDTSGNLLVGKSSSSLGTAGHEIFHNGVQWLTASNSRPLLLNRLSTDGTIAEFRKDGTTVGTIGTRAGDLSIGTNDTGINFWDASNNIIPENPSTGAARDDAINLGSSGVRFKDLHLSGTGYFGTSVGIAGATTIDDGNLQIGDANTPFNIAIAGPRAKFGYSGNNAIVQGGTAKGIAFCVNNSTLASGEAGRFDTSGNFLIGKTSSSGNTVGAELRSNGGIFGTKDGAYVARFNRLTDDGSIVEFQKDGTTVGSISAKGGDLTIQSSTSNHKGLRFGDANISPTDNNGNVQDATTSLGTSSARFTDIYATNGTIQTSDINEKQDIEDLSEAETRVAVAVKGLLKKYRWKSAVADKGDDARIHFGIMAQDLQQAFSAEGLDAGDYGMFISSTWTDETTGEEKTRLGVRYNELLAFIIAAI